MRARAHRLGSVRDVPAARASSPGLVRAIRLEQLTIAWNAAEVFVTVGLGIAARSLALVAFGLDSCIEIFASLVVVWELRGDDHPERTRRALRLVALAFALLGALLLITSAQALLVGREPHESPLGIAYLTATVAVMLLLATLKRRVGTELASATVLAEARLTLLDAGLAAGILTALALNVVAGWWWADALAASAVGVLALLEARENREAAAAT